MPIKTTEICLENDDHSSTPHGAWRNVTFKVNNCRFGQMLEIAYHLSKAVVWHNRARLFHGDHGKYASVYFDPEREMRFAWLTCPYVSEYESEMSWPWQRFFEDQSLVDLVIGTPIGEDCYDPLRSYRMIDANDFQRQEGGLRLDWGRARLSCGRGVRIRGDTKPMVYPIFGGRSANHPTDLRILRGAGGPSEATRAWQ